MVFADPDDDDVRRVAADALLEQASPWGEFITLQFRIADKQAKPPEKKRAAELAKKHLDLFAGPIEKVAHKKTVVFEKGFLVECAPERRLVPRADWEAAAEAPHWATVRHVYLSTLTTPNWWIEKWVKNPAALRSMRHVDFSNGLQIERDAVGQPWRVIKASNHRFLASMFASFAKGLPAGEAKQITFAPKIKKLHSDLIEAHFEKAGVKR